MLIKDNSEVKNILKKTLKANWKDLCCDKKSNYDDYLGDEAIEWVIDSFDDEEINVPNLISHFVVDTVENWKKYSKVTDDDNFFDKVRDDLEKNDRIFIADNGDEGIAYYPDYSYGHQPFDIYAPTE